ncbi:MAG TPA: hypothetical protein PKJ91_00185 [Methanoregulaceae archaeon]|nr:hypothetical protein [Methanoregulaceae archaeon]
MHRLTALKQPERAAKGSRENRFREPIRQPENQTKQPGRCFLTDIVDTIGKNVKIHEPGRRTDKGGGRAGWNTRLLQSRTPNRQ